MDSDDGLMLNIVESKNDAVASIQGKRCKTKWREQREQKRRTYTPYNGTRHKISKVEAKKVKSDWIFKNKVRSKETENNETRQNSKIITKPQVISSLFRHNPEIPKVKSSLESQEIKLEDTCEVKTDRPLFSGGKFSELPLSPHMVANLEKNLKMTILTSIQRAAIPALIEGQDVFVKSKTGSGKTLCYAVPVVHSLQNITPKIERNDGPYALVLVPTRELALQSLSLLQKLVKPFQWIVPGFVVGGERRKSEKARLRKGINILVATPGRLLDHIEKTACLDFKRMKWIILDEADRLLDMGFEKDVLTILQSLKDKLPSSVRCQTVLMSATLNTGVEKLVHMFLTDPQFVDESGKKDPIIREGDGTKANEKNTTQTPQQLKQFFVIVPSKMRLVTLAAFIISKHNTNLSCKSIVFLSSRDSVDFHYTLFKAVLCESEEKTFKPFKLHGNMSQTERTEVFKEYSLCTGGVLLCTDVAARGLDLPNVNWIVQTVLLTYSCDDTIQYNAMNKFVGVLDKPLIYNPPGSAVDYIHRVGRTARIGTEGQALIFLTPSEVGYLDTLAEHSIRPKEVLVSKFLRTLLPPDKQKTSKRGNAKDMADNLAQERATCLQIKFEEFVLSNAENMKCAKKAYQSFVRSYATFPVNLKHIFHIKTLHLGHVAKAFALREAPTGMFAQWKEKSKTRKKSHDKPTLQRKRGLPVDEHLSEGVSSGLRPKKRNKKGR